MSVPFLRRMVSISTIVLLAGGPVNMAAPPLSFHHPNASITLLPRLLHLLPYSLPLVRRLQFHLSSPYATVLATFPPTFTVPNTDSFAACWFDRARAPETECWIFSTYELPPGCRHRPNNNANARAQLLALFSAIAEAPYPLSYEQPRPLIVIGSVHASLLPLLSGNQALPEAGSVVSRMLSQHHKDGRSVLGGVSSVYVTWLIPPSPQSPSTVDGAKEEEWVGFGVNNIIQSTDAIPVLEGADPHGQQQQHDLPPPSFRCSPVSSSCSGELLRSRSEEVPEVGDKPRNPHLSLPEGYSFSTLTRDELPRVVASTHIPRSEKTLAELGNVCVRDENGRVASWAFLGVDGSLSSLFTEEEHRGKGLAKAVARELVEGLNDGKGGMGMKMGDRGLNGEEGWMNAYIEVGNEGSSAVARAIGGKPGWECRWISVDTSRVSEVNSRIVSGDESCNGTARGDRNFTLVELSFIG